MFHIILLYEADCPESINKAKNVKQVFKLIINESNGLEFFPLKHEEEREGKSSEI